MTSHPPGRCLLPQPGTPYTWDVHVWEGFIFDVENRRDEQTGERHVSSSSLAHSRGKAVLCAGRASQCVAGVRTVLVHTLLLHNDIVIDIDTYNARARAGAETKT